jgi:hypothetical protein
MGTVIVQAWAGAAMGRAPLTLFPPLPSGEGALLLQAPREATSEANGFARGVCFELFSCKHLLFWFRSVLRELTPCKRQLISRGQRNAMRNVRMPRSLFGNEASTALTSDEGILRNSISSIQMERS